MSQVVTSTSLAEDVAREYGVVVEASSLRKLLAKKGLQVASSLPEAEV